MNNMEFQDLIKEALNCVMDRTIMELASNDESYQQSLDEVDKAEQDYIAVKKEIPTRYKTIIEQYLDALEHNTNDYITLAYMAGMYDMARFLTVYKK